MDHTNPGLVSVSTFRDLNWILRIQCQISSKKLLAMCKSRKLSQPSWMFCHMGILLLYAFMHVLQKFCCPMMTDNILGVKFEARWGRAACWGWACYEAPLNASTLWYQHWISKACSSFDTQNPVLVHSARPSDQMHYMHGSFSWYLSCFHIVVFLKFKQVK